eukprot:TRINITY_DN2564_c0_g1_i1.p1 TRINITY_DN2564_c0_g1~~TRINITY_DN2564_c0_g1_i1.p1  ORF type:complete len:184 (+),score=22.76 TRINITY_DN2564_c0_g1_i1:177-728(+)
MSTIDKLASYQSIGTGTYTYQEAGFHDSPINWVELLYFRSYQIGTVRILYYFSLFLAIVVFVLEAVLGAKESGVGGFFLGLFYGIIYLIAIVLVSRVSCEIAISIFSIRDNINRLARNPAYDAQFQSPVPSSTASAQSFYHSQPNIDNAPQSNNSSFNNTYATTTQNLNPPTSGYQTETYQEI